MKQLRTQSLVDTYKLIQSDMRARCHYEQKQLNGLQVIKFLLYPAMLSTCIYRMQMFFYTNQLSLIAAIFERINSVIFSVDIDSNTDIGSGLLIMHSNFICIGRHVKIGKNCILAHQNTISPSPFFNGKGTNSSAGPTIGDDFIMGGGAGVYGAIALGDHVKVSMNASVETSFGDQAVLFGVPARNMTKAVADGESA